MLLGNGTMYWSWWQHHWTYIWFTRIFRLIQTGDPINIIGDVGFQVALGSPGAIQQLNEIIEQVSLESGGDPDEVKGVVQNLALETSNKGGNTQQVINNIANEVKLPDDLVSKSLSSLATEEKQGNFEAVNSCRQSSGRRSWR